MRAKNFFEQGGAQIWWGIGCHSVQIGLMIQSTGSQSTLAGKMRADELCFGWLKTIAGMKGRSQSVTYGDRVDVYVASLKRRHRILEVYQRSIRQIVRRHDLGAATRLPVVGMS